jgi:hypothetical protein
LNELIKLGELDYLNFFGLTVFFIWCALPGAFKKANPIGIG